MGKTVPSYRIALESEIARWQSFRRALKSQEKREAFNLLMDMCRGNAMASGAACNPIVFEPMLMSMALFLQKEINKLEKRLNAICQQTQQENG